MTTEQGGTGRCAERVHSDSRDFAGRPCGRLIKDEGLCGLHLSVKRRRAEKERRWEAEWEAERSDYRRTEQTAARLSAALGVPCSHTRHDVVIPANAVKRWLDNLPGGAP